jgi:hypothetical protein
MDIITVGISKNLDLDMPWLPNVFLKENNIRIESIFASLLALSIFPDNSFSLLTIRIPFPPPPAVALMRIGYPIFRATGMISSRSRIGWSYPGTTGTSA